MIRAVVPIAAVVLLAGCSGHASKQDQLNAAANQSTPAAANVLAGAAENGMNPQAALNEAARAQASNSSAASAAGNQPLNDIAPIPGQPANAPAGNSQ